MPTTFVLVPGAGGDAWTWSLVEAELQRRGFETVAVDLPGDDPRAELDDYVERVVAAGSGHPDVALVAHSLGGFSAVPACGELPVSLLVLVNAMIPAPGETAGAWWDNTGQGEARADLDLRAGRVPEAEPDPFVYFLHDVPADVVAASASHVRGQVGTVFASPARFEKWPQIPTRVVVGRDDRFFPADFQRRVAEERLGITPDELPGGHLLALSLPVALAALLESYVRAVDVAP